jgi:hypothetical protein
MQLENLDCRRMQHELANDVGCGQRIQQIVRNKRCLAVNKLQTTIMSAQPHFMLVHIPIEETQLKLRITQVSECHSHAPAYNSRICSAIAYCQRDHLETFDNPGDVLLSRHISDATGGGSGNESWNRNRAFFASALDPDAEYRSVLVRVRHDSSEIP